MKKVVIIGPAYPYRGGQALVEAHLFSTLTDLGYDCHTISFTLLYPKIFFPGKTQYDESGVRFYPHDDKITRMINSINPFSWWKTARKIRKLKPDITIFVWWMPFFGPCYWTIAFLLKLFLKTKIVFLIENYVSHENLWFDHLSSKLTLRKADFFICQSEFTKTQLLKVHKNKTVFRTTLSVFDCYDLKNYTQDSAKEKLGIKTSKVVLFFGLIRPYKGLDKLIESFRYIRDEYPDTTLLIVGEAYEDAQKYHDLIESEGIKDQTIMVSEFIPNEEVELYFKASDLVCMPYNSASQSGILMMAYGMRKPVVVTDVGGLAELVQNHKTGMIVKHNDPKLLAEGIKTTFKDQENVDFEANINNLSSSLGYINMEDMFKKIEES
ncbi:MAG: glycosyltransferase [Bacteroidota bacterium]